MELPKWEDTSPVEAGMIPQQVVETIPTQEQGALPSWQETQSLELTPIEKLKGGLEAFARGVISRPVVAAAQRVFGVTPEESRFREAGLGGAATALELAGLAGPALATLGAAGAARLGVGAAAKAVAPLATLGEFTQAGLLTKAGQAAVKKLGVSGAVATPAVALGIENAIFAAADETAKAIEGNPNSAQKALYNVALSGALGTAAGGALGKVGDLWKTKYGPKYKSFMNDFSGRVKDHARGSIPAADVVGAELQTIVNSADEATGLITGAQGLKRQEVAKLLPQKADDIIKQQANKALFDTDQYLKKVAADPKTFGGRGAGIIEEAGERLAGALADPTTTASDLFFALDDFKQQIGPLGKFDPRFMGAAEKPAAGAINDLYFLIKNNLEDEKVWGLAAKRQKEINKAASQFFKTVKDLKSVAMSKGPGGEWIVNPDKLNTLINQAKKGKGELKQNVLNNFLDAADNLYDTIDKIDNKFGVVSGVERPAMTASRAVSEKLTPGMRAADFVYQEALNTASTGAGGFVGYKAGKAIGIPGGEWLGALFGSQALEPVLKKVLPVLIRPMAGVGVAAGSVRAASQLVGAVASGENLSKLAADAIFLKDKTIPLKHVAVKDLETVDKKAREIQEDPSLILDFNDDLGQVLPEQSFALASASMNALSYLNSKRPTPKQNSPLDKEVQPNKQQMAAYYRTLEIAQNPLVVMKRIKDGSLRSSDVVDLQSMYPDLYNDMMTKIMGAMINYTAKGKRVPFKLQKQLSIFAGQPLDTTLTPQAIQAAQSTYAPKNLPAPQTPQFAPKSGRKSQMPSLTETEQQRRMRAE